MRVCFIHFCVWIPIAFFWYFRNEKQDQSMSSDYGILQRENDILNEKVAVVRDPERGYNV